VPSSGWPADAGLRVGDGDIQRQGVDLVLRGDFDSPHHIADLRAVAVRDDQLMAGLDQVRDRPAGAAGGGELIGNVETATHVDLLQSGALTGDLKAATATVAAGARMRGMADFGWENSGKGSRSNGADHKHS
jgi:hypothetical protein